jgi:soluble lytic murein transglycosylase-like protein
MLQELLILAELARQVLLATVAILTVSRAEDLTPRQAAHHAACLVDAANRFAVPWQRIAAVIDHETRWKADAVSQSNDFGLGQIHCPSRWCRRVPTPAQRKALLDPCHNIHMTAMELAHKRGLCRHRGRDCRNGAYVSLYNPGQPKYYTSIRRLEARFRRF